MIDAERASQLGNRARNQNQRRRERKTERLLRRCERRIRLTAIMGWNRAYVGTTWFDDHEVKAATGVLRQNGFDVGYGEERGYEGTGDRTWITITW